MSLEDDVRALARNPTLRDLGPEALRLIAFSAETRMLRAGDILFRRGEMSDGGYVILRGAVALEVDGGPASIAVPPTLMGDVALIAETVRPATALAREPTTVLKISRTLFRRVLAEYPDSAVALRRTLAARLQALSADLDTVRTEVFDG